MLDFMSSLNRLKEIWEDEEEKGKRCIAITMNIQEAEQLSESAYRQVKRLVLNYVSENDDLVEEIRTKLY